MQWQCIMLVSENCVGMKLHASSLISNLGFSYLHLVNPNSIACVKRYSFRTCQQSLLPQVVVRLHAYLKENTWRCLLMSFHEGGGEGEMAQERSEVPQQ